MLLTLPSPFYEGVAVSTDTRADIAIAGHPYMVDWARDDALVIGSIPLSKPQSDTSNRPGEQTLNPEGLWRRSVESWHHGTGQSWVDRGEEPDPYRFADSRGVNPWTRAELTLLNDTTRTVTSANTNLPLTVAAGKAFLGDGSTVRVSANGTSWSALTGGGTGPIYAMTSDGAVAYVAYANSVHKTTGGALTSFDATGVVHVLQYAAGRLWGGEGFNLYTWDAGGTATPAYVHANTAWSWDAIAGAGWVYAMGHAGDRAAIYKTREDVDNVGDLTVPVVCGQLPDGEIGLALCTYLGYLLIGTTEGVRLAQLDASGDLTIGALIPVSGGVRAFEPQGQFVWFTWDNPDTHSTGLGRLDLTVFVDTLAPAYATDLQAPVQGAVRSVVTLGDRRLFTVSASGVWLEDDEPVDSGWLSWGRVTFGIPDTKTALFADVRHLPLPADSSVGLSLSADDGTARVLSTSALAGSVTTADAMSTFQARGSWFTPRVTLTGGATLTRLTLRADPRAERTEQIVVTILLRDRVDVSGNVEYAYHTCDEYTFLTTLRDSRQVVAFQFPGFHSWPVIVEDTQFVLSHNKTNDQCLHQGSLTLRLKRV